MEKAVPLFLHHPNVVHCPTYIGAGYNRPDHAIVPAETLKPDAGHYVPMGRDTWKRSEGERASESVGKKLPGFLMEYCDSTLEQQFQDERESEAYIDMSLSRKTGTDASMDNTIDVGAISSNNVVAISSNNVGAISSNNFYSNDSYYNGSYWPDSSSGQSTSRCTPGSQQVPDPVIGGNLSPGVPAGPQHAYAPGRGEFTFNSHSCQGSNTEVLVDVKPLPPKKHERSRCSQEKKVNIDNSEIISEKEVLGGTYETQPCISQACSAESGERADKLLETMDFDSHADPHDLPSIYLLQETPQSSFYPRLQPVSSTPAPSFTGSPAPRGDRTLPPTPMVMTEEAIYWTIPSCKKNAGGCSCFQWLGAWRDSHKSCYLWSMRVCVVIFVFAFLALSTIGILHMCGVIHPAPHYTEPVPTTTQSSDPKTDISQGKVVTEGGSKTDNTVEVTTTSTTTITLYAERRLHNTRVICRTSRHNTTAYVSCDVTGDPNLSLSEEGRKCVNRKAGVILKDIPYMCACVVCKPDQSDSTCVDSIGEYHIYALKSSCLPR